MSDMIVLNGRILKTAEATLSPEDRGFLYGDGLFETLKARRGRVDLLARHLSRMARGAEELRIGFPWRNAIPGLIAQLLERNGLLDRAASVKICLSRGRHEGHLNLYRPREPSLAIFAKPYEEPDLALWEKGLAVSVEKDIRQNPLSGICHLKSMSYLPYLMARTRAEEKGFQEALLTNGTGQVCECTTANIFSVRDDRFETPRVSCGLLPGTVRSALLDLLAQEGLPVLEVDMTVDRLLESREVFVTNALREVFPVGRLDDCVFSGRDQTRKVRDLFRRWIDATNEAL